MSEIHSLQLTPEEAALIDRYFGFYRALDIGQRLPESEAQRHFVEVCRCQAKATSLHEIAYFKFRMLAKVQHDEPVDAAQRIDEFGEGVPQPGWFTDDGWKRMRGQYLSNSD
ncbi:MAG: DUF413 domain-containing protein [Pirellulales bacterium]